MNLPTDPKRAESISERVAAYAEKVCDCGQVGQHDCLWQYFDSIRNEMKLPDLVRQDRKNHVFHVMYGSFRDATEEEMYQWRRICVAYINSVIHDVPLTLCDFRRVRDAS